MPADLAARYKAEGWWTDDSLGPDGGQRPGSHGEPWTFEVHSKVRPWAGTFADVDRAARIAGRLLRARGLGPGDVVVVQLPNWVEAGITFWAAAYLGAVVVPIVHFYGAKEVELHPPGDLARRGRHRRSLRHSDYLATYSDLLAQRPGPALAGGR